MAALRAGATSSLPAAEMMIALTFCVVRSVMKGIWRSARASFGPTWMTVPPVSAAPLSMPVLAAAQVVSQAGKADAVKVTGLGFPNDMKAFVKDGTSPVFGLWSVPDLGYLSYQVAAKLVAGEITGKEGETFTVKGLNDDKPYTIGKDGVVILGPAFRFDSTNVENFDF